MSRHKVALGAFLLVLSLLAAACGDQPQETAAEGAAANGPEPSSQEQPPGQEPTAGDAETAGGSETADGSEDAEDAEIVMIGYGGDLAIPYRDFLIAPFLEDHPGVSVDIIPSESGDFVAQIKAAQGASPYDVVPLGESRLVTAIEEGWIAEVGEEAMPNIEEAYPVFADACRGYGAPVTYSLIGLAYNPDRVPAPESWEDLWTNPEYEGEIGLVSSASNLGFAFLVMAARLAGGEEDLASGLDKIAELEPFVVAPNPTSLAQLFERGEIGIAPLWNNDAAVLKDKGLNVEFVRPEPGAIADVTCMTKVENTAYPELAEEIINRAMGEDYQQQAAQPPFFFGPTNQNVEVGEDASDYLLTSLEEFDSLVRIDWEAAAPARSEITEQFNQRFGT